MKGYTNIKNIENYLLTEIELGFEEQVEEWIEQAEAFIERETGRVFIADTETSERLYDGDNDTILFIDDCISISKVEVNDIEIEVYPYPANYTPTTRIISSTRFTKGKQNVKVTAKWGYSESVPADIKQATTMLVAGFIDKGLKPKGDINTISLGQYSAGFGGDIMKAKMEERKEQIKEILSKYRRYD